MRRFFEVSRSGYYVKRIDAPVKNLALVEPDKGVPICVPKHLRLLQNSYMVRTKRCSLQSQNCAANDE